MPIFIDTRGNTKLAIGICARCSCKMPYSELLQDPNYPGLYVCRDDLDNLDPYRLPARSCEDITLDHARPDVKIDSPGPSPNLVADPLFGLTEIGYRTTWQPNTPYTRGASVTPQNIDSEAIELPQQWMVCTTAGTSGASPPAWPLKPGQWVTDGGVTWFFYYGVYPV